jgi:hypothetical protein
VVVESATASLVIFHIWGCLEKKPLGLSLILYEILFKTLKSSRVSTICPKDVGSQQSLALPLLFLKLVFQQLHLLMFRRFSLQLLSKLHWIFQTTTD